MVNKNSTTSMRIVWHPEREEYRVTFEATEDIFHDVVRALKAIDFELRSYNSDTRSWYIDPSQLDTLRQIAADYFDNAQLIEGDTTKNLVTGRVTQQLRLFADE